MLDERAIHHIGDLVFVTINVVAGTVLDERAIDHFDRLVQ